jgi:putative salt-induced outer membrane protein YdiY
VAVFLAGPSELSERRRRRKPRLMVDAVIEAKTMKFSMRYTNVLIQLFFFLTVGFFAAGASYARTKADVVLMKNGDRFTGEIKKLEHGILYFKASYMMDSVQLDWDQVADLESDDQFFITLTNGTRLEGKLEKSQAEKNAGTVHLVTAGRTMEISDSDLTTIRQKEENFLSQLNGSVNYGLNFTRDNDAISSALNASVEYRRAKNVATLSTSSQFTGQSNAPSTNRYTFDAAYQRELTQKWFVTGLFDLLKSDQQQLNLRTTSGGGIGRRLYRTDKTGINLIGGIVFDREKYFPQNGVNTTQLNGEAIVGLNFYTFRFKVFDLSSETAVYPSMTDPGRVRISSVSNLEIEIVRNFSWNFHVYENFDSRPPIAAPRNDLGITTGLGWTF